MGGGKHAGVALMNIQFGCGGNLLPGWNNHDIEVDVTKPLDYPDKCADMIFAEHLCEHLTAPEFLRFLDECWRVLKRGGRLRICCPVIGPWLGREHARDLTFSHGHKLVLTEDVLRTFFWMAGFSQNATRRTDRKPQDGHWKVIGLEKDALETCRMEATK
jgi:SAM-dependent methyltransferase